MSGDARVGRSGVCGDGVVWVGRSGVCGDGVVWVDRSSVCGDGVVWLDRSSVCGDGVVCSYVTRPNFNYIGYTCTRISNTIE